MAQTIVFLLKPINDAQKLIDSRLKGDQFSLWYFAVTHEALREM